MSTAPILICYDGTDEAHHAIDSAAALLGPRRAIVLDVTPIMTLSESVAATSPVVPGAAFMELNEDDGEDAGGGGNGDRQARGVPGRAAGRRVGADLGGDRRGRGRPRRGRDRDGHARACWRTRAVRGKRLP